MNIAHPLAKHAALNPQKTAIRFEQNTLSYQQLNNSANQLANYLQVLGIQRGDRVALFLPNIPEFTIAYYAIQKLGAIAVSLNSMLKSGEVTFIVNDADAKVIITTAELQQEIAQPDISQTLDIVIVETEDKSCLAPLLADMSDQFKTVELSANDPAALLYTSGTTGFPKGATLSHHNIIANIAAAIDYTDMTADDRLQIFLPLFHCFGQNFIMNASIYANAQLVLQRRFVPEQTIASITDDQVTMFFGVPTIYIYLLNADLSADVFSKTRYHFSGAAPLPQEVATQWHDKYHHRIYEGYGLTETSPFASYNHKEQFKLGSIGTPIDGVEMKIIDDEGTEVTDDKWGEIVIKGHNVMLGYWGKEQATKEAIIDGWFHSGDVGRRDEDGYFYICDRMKDMINHAGFNVYPAEIENSLHAHPAIAEVAVYGVNDGLKGEKVVASIVVKTEENVSIAELDQFCREHMAAYKIPQQWLFTDAIPKGATGKILKRVLRDAENAKN